VGLASIFVGRGSPALNFYGILLVAPDSPSPHACTHLSLKWSTMAFDPTTGKTPRTCKKPFPPFDPSWHLSWATRVLPHERSLNRQFTDGTKVFEKFRTQSACFCVLTPLLFRRIRARIIPRRHAYLNRRAATLLIWTRLYRSSEVMNQSNVLTAASVLCGDRTTWHKPWWKWQKI
jgi:hypothetical protein